MTTSVVVYLVAGLVLLVVGAEALVRGASRLALAVGVTPLVIGLTVVAFGTSAPEMAVSAAAALHGQADLALGNAIGSNIFNVLFILGVSALIVPLVVDMRLIRFDIPLMVALSLGVWLLALDGRLGRFDGVLLLAGIVAYTAFLVVQARRERNDVTKEWVAEFGAPVPGARASVLTNLGLIVAGLGLLVLGSRWLVYGAVAFARWVGVDELLIGLTIVAAGTSLPEVATSVTASLRGERDIAVGNVIGSNIFNLLAVLGIAGVLGPSGVQVAPRVLYFDMLVMLAVAVACLPIFFTGHRIARWEGGLFLGYYVVYVAYLVLTLRQSGWATQLGDVMLIFVLPLTAVTLVLVTVRSRRAA